MTTTKKPAAAAEKAAPKPVPEKPYELQPAPGRPAPIMSAALGIQHDEPRITPPNRGPATGRDMTDLEYLQVHATPAELAAAKQAVEQRLARDLTTWAWERCSHCGLTLKVKPTSPEGDPCVRCNKTRTTTGGHFKRMDTAAVDAHLYTEAVRERAGLERDRRRAHVAENIERAKRGDQPLTFQQFTARAKADFAEMKARGRAVGQVSGLFRRQQ